VLDLDAAAADDFLDEAEDLEGEEGTDEGSMEEEAGVLLFDSRSLCTELSSDH